ncbi:MAG: flagellar hook-length control protein FliK [Deltaproteobacteria bacterium]|nr:flagellar hook-length control protein FliK [Deltaproteobacteria bacterium]
MKQNLELQPAAASCIGISEAPRRPSKHDLFESLLDGDSPQHDRDDDIHDVDIVVALDAMPLVAPAVRAADEAFDRVGLSRLADATEEVPPPKRTQKTARDSAVALPHANEPQRPAVPLTKPIARVPSGPNWAKPVMDMARTAVFQCDAQAAVSLEHPTLGALQVRVTKTDGVFTVEIAVASEASRQALQSELPELHAAFAEIGLRLSRVGFQLKVGNTKKQGEDHGNRRHPNHRER